MVAAGRIIVQPELDLAIAQTPLHPNLVDN